MIGEALRSPKEEIVRLLTSYLEHARSELSTVNGFGRDVIDRILEFAVRGKLIRGCLVGIGYLLGRGGPRDEEPLPQAVYEAGVAIELFQSGLLIKDDIMDRDLLRRGRPSLFSQYVEWAEREGIADAYHLGESLGSCAGDVACFLAFRLLAGISAESNTIARTVGLCARELAMTGVAQMQDLHFGVTSDEVVEREILSLYRFKTGRYSFSLPLAIGAELARAEGSLLLKLEEIGESLGILFQIRDDEIGLFGDERLTGKPVGSDLRAGKKTLLMARLMEAADDAERNRLRGILGNPGLTDEDLEWVRGRARATGALAATRRVASSYQAQARALIAALPSSSAREYLLDLLTLTLSRSR